MLWRLQWGTVGEPSTDTPARPDTLADGEGVLCVCVACGLCVVWLVCLGFFLFVGEFVFLFVCLCACDFLVVCLLFALFAACVCFPFWVCSAVSVFVVFSCAVSCVLMDFRLPS